jgi:hypothetical protein
MAARQTTLQQTNELVDLYLSIAKSISKIAPDLMNNLRDEAIEWFGKQGNSGKKRELQIFRPESCISERFCGGATLCETGTSTCTTYSTAMFQISNRTSF